MAIRTQPTDFLVEELIDEKVTATGGTAPWLPVRTDKATHAVFRLVKTSMTTPDAINKLGKSLRVKPANIDYAGLKDKHAQTAQHISVPGLDARKAASLPKTLSGEGWGAKLIGWSPKPLSAEAIRGNRFRIVIRDLAKEASTEMDRRAGLLALPGSAGAAGPGAGVVGGPAALRTLLVINYFGAQRFGSARHGKGFVAAALVRGEFEEALRLAIGTPARKDAGKTRDFTRVLARDWGNWGKLAAILPMCPERKAIEVLSRRTVKAPATPEVFREAFAALPFFLQSMYLEAFQSKIWNGTARRVVERINAGGVPAKVARSLQSDDQYGTMLFAPASALAGPLGSVWRGLNVPLLAPKSVLTPPWGEAAQAALDDEKVTLAQLRVPGLDRPFFGEAPRPLVVEATRFELSAAEPDGTGKRVKRVTGFELPRGAYATVVLRALGQ